MKISNRMDKKCSSNANDQMHLLCSSEADGITLLNSHQAIDYRLLARIVLFVG